MFQPPSFALLTQGYPLGSQSYVKNLIGGEVNTPIVTDTCAVRMSRALNLAGVQLPSHDPALYTLSGKDKRHYALRMQELKRWIAQRFGAPQITSHMPASRAAFSGVKGIIAFDITFGLNTDGRTRALGHLDLWDGSAYTHQAEDPRDYFDLAKEVALWKSLP
jgi:hypothetical protein